MVEQAKEVAADVLEANPADIILDTSAGTFAVTGSPSVAIGWAEVAAQAADANQPLAAENDFQPPAATFPFGVHLSVVDVDRDTGEVGSCGTRRATTPASSSTPPSSTVRSTAAWPAASARPDGGIRLRRMGQPADRQLHGLRHPGGIRIPELRPHRHGDAHGSEPLGVKGIGEAGTIGSTPAVQNAVVDALKHLGVRHVDIPVTPMRVWRAIHKAGQ